MGTNENTKLWSNDFWRICIANFLLSVSLYMLWPILPVWIMSSYGVTTLQAGGVTVLFGVAIFLLGPSFSYLVDTYKRKSICLLAILIITIATGGFWLAGGLLYVTILRIIQGIMYGMAFMASGSTLVIDITQSPRRTEANNAFSWFGRFGFSIGPFIGLIFYEFYSIQIIIIISCLLGLLSFLCIAFLRIPFRAPLCPPIFSKDRFWLSNGWLMFINLLFISIPTGILLATIHSYEFYGILMAGFCLSILAVKFVFTDADIRSEIVSGLILYGTAMLLQISHHEEAAFYTSALLVGLGIGLIVPRILVFFIQLSEHCERGTANTSEAFGWELGISIGFFIGYILISRQSTFSAYSIVLGFLIAALVLYLLITHTWYLKHRIR